MVPKVTEKPWGYETLLESNNSYCVKTIVLNKGCRTSLQYHRNKLETTWILSGEGTLELDDTTMKLFPGQNYTVLPASVHRVTAGTDTNLVYLECSTPHLDDVVRLKDDYERSDPEAVVLPKDVRPKTVFLDIDGCIFEHQGNILNQHLTHPKLLPGVRERLVEWDLKGYRIVLVTGRRASTRAATEEQLSESGVIYDELVMGVTGGARVLINDLKTIGVEPTAVAVTVKRNEGLLDVNI